MLGTKAVTTSQFIATAFATNIAIGLATTAISKQIGKDYESEDTEEEVDEEIEDLLKRYEAYLRKIFAFDAFSTKLSGYGSNKLENELMIEASKIMTRYTSRKFRSTGETFATGVVTGTAGLLLGGGMAGNIASTAANAGLGIIKASEAVDYFGRHFGEVVSSVSSHAMGSSQMMEKRLENSFTNLGADIMRALNDNGFVVGEDIKYSECNQIQSFNLGNFNAKRAGIENICLEVAGFMQAFEQEKAHFRLRLKDNVARQVDGIIKHEVIPAFSGLIASNAVDVTKVDKLAANAVLGAGSFIKNKLFPGHDAQIAEQKTSHYTIVQEDATPIKRPKTAPAKAKTAANENSKKHTVKRGDTLSQIAKAHGTTVKDLQDANPQIKDPNKIDAGMTLNVPAGNTAQATASSQQPLQRDGYKQAKAIIDKLDGPSSFEKKTAHEQLDKVIKATENLSPEQLKKLESELNRRHEEKRLLNKILNAGQASADFMVIDMDTAKAAGAIEACFSNPACMMAVRSLPIAAYIGVVLHTENTLSDKFPWYKRLMYLENVPWDLMTRQCGNNPACSQIFERNKADSDSKNQQRAPSVSNTNTPMPPDPCDWKPGEHGWTKNKEGKWHHPDAENIKGVHNKPNVQNSKLSKQLDELYRPENKRPGGTAGELRREAERGCDHKRHLDKAEERIINLKRTIEQEDLSRVDRKTAERVINDLRDAINKAKTGK